MAVLLKPPVGMIAPAEQLWIVCALRNTGGVPLKVGHGGGEARLTLLARGPDNASLVFHYPDPAGTPSADEEREGIETLDPGDILLLGPSGRDASIAQWRVPGLKSKGAWLLRFVYQSYKLNGDAPGPRRWKGAVTSQLIRMDYPLLPDLEAFAEAAPGAPSLEALGLASDRVVVGRIETISEPRQLRLDAGGPAVEGRSGVLRVSKSLLERRRRAPAPVTLTEKDDGRTVTLPVGGQLTVRLAGDRPGAVWTVAETAASSVLKPATAWFEPQVLAENSSDGTYVFEFSGAVPGETMLRLRYGPKSGSARTVLREIGYTVRVDTGS
jgi:hypothetical protein